MCSDNARSRRPTDASGEEKREVKKRNRGVLAVSNSRWQTCVVVMLLISLGACAAPGPLDNHVAVIALCHLLANSVIELSDHAGRERLAGIEARHDAMGEF